MSARAGGGGAGGQTGKRCVGEPACARAAVVCPRRGKEGGGRCCAKPGLDVPTPAGGRLTTMTADEPSTATNRAHVTARHLVLPRPSCCWPAGTRPPALCLVAPSGTRGRPTRGSSRWRGTAVASTTDKWGGMDQADLLHAGAGTHLLQALCWSAVELAATVACTRTVHAGRRAALPHTRTCTQPRTCPPTPTPQRVLHVM